MGVTGACVKDPTIVALLWRRRFESGPGTWVKDLALPQLWCRWQWWLRFDPWPRNFHIPQVQGEKKKRRDRPTKT